MATPGEVRYPTTDLTLAQRLEGAEAATNIAFVQGRGRVAPVVGATYLHVGGVAAMFDGPESAHAVRVPAGGTPPGLQR